MMVKLEGHLGKKILIDASMMRRICVGEMRTASVYISFGAGVFGVPYVDDAYVMRYFYYLMGCYMTRHKIITTRPYITVSPFRVDAHNQRLLPANYWVTFVPSPAPVMDVLRVTTMGTTPIRMSIEAPFQYDAMTRGQTLNQANSALNRLRNMDQSGMVTVFSGLKVADNKTLLSFQESTKISLEMSSGYMFQSQPKAVEKAIELASSYDFPVILYYEGSAIMYFRRFHIINTVNRGKRSMSLYKDDQIISCHIPRTSLSILFSSYSAALIHARNGTVFTLGS